MTPNSIWETLSRRLSRFGDVGPIRRALERVGLDVARRVRDLADETIERIEIDQWARERKASAMARGVCWMCDGRGSYRHCPQGPAEDECDECNGTGKPFLARERSKQIPAVWQAADRAERGVE